MFRTDNIYTIATIFSSLLGEGNPDTTTMDFIPDDSDEDDIIAEESDDTDGDEFVPVTKQVQKAKKEKQKQRGSRDTHLERGNVYRGSAHEKSGLMADPSCSVDLAGDMVDGTELASFDRNGTQPMARRGNIDLHICLFPL